MEEKDIEIKSEKARSLVGRMPSFYTIYGIIITSAVLFIFVVIFCNIKVPEILKFQVVKLSDSNLAYITMPVGYEIQENVDFIIVSDSLMSPKRRCAISRIKKHKTNKYVYFVYPSKEVFASEKVYAEISVYRFTILQCLKNCL